MLGIWAYNYDWGGIIPPEILPTKGGISDREYKRYRKHLESMMRASENREAQLYNKSVKAVEKLAAKANIEIPKPKAVIQENKKIEYILPDFSRSAIAAEQLLAYITELREARIRASIQLDDDITLLVMLA